jgi:hypothetical protein
MRNQHHSRVNAASGFPVCSMGENTAVQVRTLIRVTVLFTFLLFAGRVSQADVIVYSGSLAIAADAETSGVLPKKGRAFFIFDFVTQQTASIFLDPIKKRVSTTFAPEVGVVALVSTPPLRGGKTATVLSRHQGGVFSPGIFIESFDYLRGVNKSLVTRTFPNRGITTAPRLFNRRVAITGTFGPHTFIDMRSLLTFHGPRTVAANDANKTILQVFDDLMAELRDKGYDT